MNGMFCETCKHFDKAAFPKNPMFGQCKYVLPMLPKWVHPTDPAYRAVSINLKNCSVHSANDAAGDEK